MGPQMNMWKDSAEELTKIFWEVLWLCVFFPWWFLQEEIDSKTKQEHINSFKIL